MDISRNRSCPDALLIETDPPELPTLTTRGDTLLMLETTGDSTGASQTVIRKHLIDASTCRWLPRT